MPDMSGPLTWTVLLKVRSPPCSWCRMALDSFLGVSARVLEFHSAGEGRTIEVVEFEGPRWRRALERARSHSLVEEVEVLEGGTFRGTVQIASRGCLLPEAMEATGVVPKTPFLLEGDVEEWRVIGRKSKVQGFCDFLRKRGASLEVLSVKRTSPTFDLTPRQEEILSWALALGYYDYPRRITLTELSRRVGVSKSTLSEMLMMIEQRIMSRYRDGAGRDRPSR